MTVSVFKKILDPDPDLEDFQTYISDNMIIKIRSVVLCEIANRLTPSKTWEWK